MKKKIVLISFLLFFALAATFYSMRQNSARESIIFFPIEPHAHYKAAATLLTFSKSAQNLPYKIRWVSMSELDKTAYLRQDVSLLFFNGRLVDTMGQWKTNTAALIQKKFVLGNQSSLLEALTFHYSELHHSGSNPTSAQEMSHDRLFVITNQGPVYAFHTPSNAEAKEWQRTLELQTDRIVQESWNKSLRDFSIDPDQYTSFPLTSFLFNGKNALPGFTLSETNRIGGNLWEGLYKNYFLGIKKRNGTIIDPNGSTLPIIMIAKNRTHLLVLLESADGEPILLKQSIEQTR